MLHQIFARSRTVRRLTVGSLARVELAILGGHKQGPAMEVIRRVRRERESLLSGNEAFMIHSLARSQRAVGGVMAEVGVFQGCSAKLISLGGRPERLHLFDTFAGLPQPDRAERRSMDEGHYAASLEAVRSYLSDQPNLVFHKGLFTGADTGCEDERFSLVHLDVDLKEGTLACLRFFYPRMLPGRRHRQPRLFIPARRARGVRRVPGRAAGAGGGAADLAGDADQAVSRRVASCGCAERHRHRVPPPRPPGLALIAGSPTPPLGLTPVSVPDSRLPVEASAWWCKDGV